MSIALLAGALFLQATAAWAQDEDEVDIARLERLAKEFTDPLTTLPQIFLQDASALARIDPLPLGKIDPSVRCGCESECAAAISRVLDR